MTQTKYEQGDIKLISLSITNHDNTATVDVRSQLSSLSIYEDISQPTIYAELALVDGKNLVKDLPILGEETLEISFITPTRETITTYKLRVYAITGQVNLPSNKAVSYTLKAVSEEHFINNDFYVTNSYKDTIDNIVYDILKNQIKTQKNVFIEQTRGLTPIIFSRNNPFICIDMLRQKAVNKTPFGGLFFFYENQYGIHFKSVDKMIEEGKSTIDSKEFFYEVASNTDRIRKSYQYRNLLRFEHLKKNDSIVTQASGVFSNITKSFDILTKKVSDTSFKLNEQASNIQTGQRSAAELPISKSFLTQKSDRSSFTMFVPSDTDRGNDLLKDVLGYKQSLSHIINLNIVRGMIYGDSYISVGDMIKLNLPDTSSTNDKEVYDSRYSGNYIIQKLRHIIVPEDNKFKHNIAFDANKIGITG